LFLKSLELYGFKSFADRVKLQFSDGITSLLGPNGCGKSNIVDAIKWVLGEQSTKTLRASKMEDVIFNGTDLRKPLQVAEVILVLSNENGDLPIDEPEVEIKRRIFRTGESEYYINRNRVRLMDVRDLFFDTGVGKSAYSILEQGKIDQILSSRPEDRRYIFEEAAGISRYKVQSLEAKRKLERTDENIAQVETILREVKRNYDTKKGQAEKAKSYRELRKEQFTLEVDIQLSTLVSYSKLREVRLEQEQTFSRQYQAKRAELETFDESLAELREELRTLGSSRIAIQTELMRLDEATKGRGEKLDLLTVRYRDFLNQQESAKSRGEGIKGQIERDQAHVAERTGYIAQIDERIKQLEGELKGFLASLGKSRKTIEDHINQIGTLEKSNTRLEEETDTLSLEVNELSDAIVIQLEEQLRSSGYTTKARNEARSILLAELEHIRQSILKEQEFFAKLKAAELSVETLFKRQHEFFSTLRDSLASLSDHFAVYEGTQASFLDELIAPEGTIAKKQELDQAIAQKRKEIIRNRERVAHLREENLRLQSQMDLFQDAIAEHQSALSQLRSNKESAQAWIANLRSTITEREYEYKDALAAATNAQERIYETQEDIRATEAEVKEIKTRIADLNRELEVLATRIEEQSRLIQDRESEKEDTFDEIQNLRSEREKAELHAQNLEEQIAGLYTNFFDTYGKSLKEFEHRLEEEELDDSPVLRARLEEVKKRVSGMGYINQMAEQEFSEIKEQYDFLTRQLDDLAKAKADLDNVITEITTRSEELFMTTYKEISAAFQAMFRRLFGGGRAELSLIDPDNILESGIDILAQPPGKKLTHLTLLSGGERSMTAVALLFATYSVKPSPFTVLDEIDAALDDRNIGYFLSLLEEFAQKSQFIIVTHNKHTVMGSTTLLGVTQMEPGVSTMVSYRLDTLEGKPVILNDDEQAVDFNEEGSLIS